MGIAEQMVNMIAPGSPYRTFNPPASTTLGAYLQTRCERHKEHSFWQDNAVWLQNPNPISESRRQERQTSEVYVNESSKNRKCVPSGAIEALTPQDIDKENARDKLNPVLPRHPGSMLPQDDPEHTVRILRPAKCGATPQAGVYHLSEILKCWRTGAREAVPERT